MSCLGLCLVILGVRYGIHARTWNKRVMLETERRQNSRSENEKAERDLDVVRAEHARQEEQAHRKMLADTDRISGAAADRKRAEEWARRQRHDPALASSAMEVNLLKMEGLGRDPAVSALRALKEVATMASPPGSRVEVSPFQERFLVKIAYAHSSLAEGEAGGVTRHHNVQTLRREVEVMSAQITRDVFEACGSRGIEKLQISYNHGMQFSLVPRAATEAERAQLLKKSIVRMSRLHRVALDQKRAAGVSDWHSLTLTRVKGLLAVEYDSLDRINIVTGELEAGEQKDPTGQLEF